MSGNVWMAFGLTLAAGLATAIGSLIVFFARRTNYRFLSITTGFSAGVMLYVSFVEIFFKGEESLVEALGAPWGRAVNVLAFFGGILLIGVIDAFIPAAENPHEMYSPEETKPLKDPSHKPPALPAEAEGAPRDHKKLMRMGLFTALAITLHNFPEGLVTFLVALQDPALGMVIAVAIALHNIPEGISVAVPIYYATGSRSKAFAYSLLSGLAEPVGALIAYAALRLVYGGEDGAFPAHIMGILFSGVAGIMVYISLDELLPASRTYGKGHDSILGLVSGMAVMAISLLLLG